MGKRLYVSVCGSVSECVRRVSVCESHPSISSVGTSLCVCVHVGVGARGPVFVRRGEGGRESVYVLSPLGVSGSVVSTL